MCGGLSKEDHGRLLSLLGAEFVTAGLRHLSPQRQATIRELVVSRLMQDFVVNPSQWAADQSAIVGALDMLLTRRATTAASRDRAVSTYQLPEGLEIYLPMMFPDS